MNSELNSTDLVQNLNTQLEQATISKDQLESEDQITHILKGDKECQNEHGQKLFNAINCLLDDDEQLQLTEALFKYQSDYNVFTLVRSCCELFDTSRKKSLMLFMRPVIPIKDRFHYDEYYKLFFPEEFAPGIKSIFCDLIPKELLDKTLKKAHEKKILTIEKQKENEAVECLNAIKILEKVNSELNMDIQKLMSESGQEATQMLNANPANIQIKKIDDLLLEKNDMQKPIQIGGFRIIEIAPDENESLGFDVCMGPTGTFIMISYVDPNSLVNKLGMKPGDELVSVNETSFKMITLDQAVDILSSEPTMRIVLQTSGFMPEFIDEPDQQLISENGICFNNEWMNPFGKLTLPPGGDNSTLKRYIRRITLIPKSEECLGFKIRGGIDYSLGIFISKVDPKSDAASAGLRATDQIIEVNGQTFARISHSDALRAIKQSVIDYFSHKAPIKLTVRYLGKLPQLLSKETKLSEAIQTIEAKPDYSNDSEIKLSDSLKKLTRTTSIMKEDDLYNQEFVHFKLNTHYDVISDKKCHQINSYKNYFNSNRDLKLFRYYLNDYLNSRINIKYFLYLITNHLLSAVKQLIDNNQLNSLIKFEDLEEVNTFLNTRKELLAVELDNGVDNDEATSYVYLMCQDDKKRLVTRSTESLSDKNEFTPSDQNHLKKLFHKSFDNLVELC